jgi:hypothetical protein
MKKKKTEMMKCEALQVGGRLEKGEESWKVTFIQIRWWSVLQCINIDRRGTLCSDTSIDIIRALLAHLISSIVSGVPCIFQGCEYTW